MAKSVVTMKIPLDLHHGWSLNSSAWQYVNATLSHKFQVVTWDLAGLGKSRGPSNNDYRLEKFADDLRAILEHVAPSGLLSWLAIVSAA